MSSVTPNMGLTKWDSAGDFFSYVQLADNFQALDDHDHSSGKGVQISTAGIGNLQVTTGKIANDAITNVKMANNSVDAAEIVANAVTTAKINALAVTTAKLDNDSVTAAKIAAGAVGTSELADNSVGGIDLHPETVAVFRTVCYGNGAFPDSFALAGATETFWLGQTLPRIAGGGGVADWPSGTARIDWAAYDIPGKTTYLCTELSVLTNSVAPGFSFAAFAATYTSGGAADSIDFTTSVVTGAAATVTTPGANAITTALSTPTAMPSSGVIEIQPFITVGTGPGSFAANSFTVVSARIVIFHST